MKEKVENIRALFREGETDAALEALELFLDESENPLRDDAILLRGRFSKWERDKNLGISPPESEVNAIVLAGLDLLKKAEKGVQKRLDPQPTAQNFQPTAQNPPQNSNWKGRFFIDSDPREYYLAPTGQIFCLDAATRQPFQVAQQFASNDPRFAFTYFVAATNFWYSVDFQGVIWTINFYGMVVRVGQFQAF